MKNQPLVSVVMPAYNAEEFIGMAMESILAQTYPNFEFIIVEDASTDQTCSIIQKYKDPRIKLIVNSENKGISYSTNTAIDLSKGKYIALMDDDDIAVKDRLKWQVEYMEAHNDIDILGGRSDFIDKYGKHMKFGNTPRNNPHYIKAVLLFGNIDFQNGTAMIRKEFIEKNGLRYEENCYGMQDFKFYIDSSKLGKISSVDQVLLKYRLHGGNETWRRLDSYKEPRAKTYASFQKESLERSGFRLDEESMTFLNRILCEVGGYCKTVEEFNKLYSIFNTILRQAKEMEIDYFEELEHVCKTKLAKQLMRLNIWRL